MLTCILDPFLHNSMYDMVGQLFCSLKNIFNTECIGKDRKKRKVQILNRRLHQVSRSIEPGVTQRELSRYITMFP